MSTTEQQEVKEILRKLDEHIADFRVFKTQLMGTDEGEVSEGRLPRLEAAVKGQGKRVSSLESIRLRGAGAAWLVTVILLIAEFFYHVRGAFKP